MNIVFWASRRAVVLVLLSVVAAGCAGNGADALRTSPGETMVRTELFFGMDRADGADVTDTEWQTFVDEVVTPRFPAGLTVLSASGQWRDSSGAVIQENSRVIVLLRSTTAPKTLETSIEEIRTTYVERFHQDAVMRVDSVVRTSF